MLQPAPYTPKATHPWRRYRKTKEEVLKPQEIPKSKLYPFLKELVDNWDDYDLGLSDKFSSGRVKYMADSSIALWLADHLNRHFALRNYEEEEYEY